MLSSRLLLHVLPSRFTAVNISANYGGKVLAAGSSCEITVSTDGGQTVTSTLLLQFAFDGARVPARLLFVCLCVLHVCARVLECVPKQRVCSAVS